MKTISYFFLALCLIGFVHQAQSSTGFLNLAVTLNTHQANNGGFRSSSIDPPTLEATSNALFIASLLAEQHTINVEDALSFLGTLENSDHGFGQQPGAPTDLESVRQYVLSHHYLRKPVQNGAKIQTYLKTLIDSSSKLFASKSGQKSDLKSTALAFDVIRLLDQAKDAAFKASVASAKAYLSAHEVVNELAHFEFPEESLDLVSANYYATVLGAAVDYEFNLPKFAHYIAALQDKEGANAGGFFGDSGRTIVTFDTTVNAASTLFILQQHYDKELFFSRVDEKALVKYTVSNHITNLKLTAKALTVIATTKSLFELVQPTFAYEVLNGNVGTNPIVQGIQLRPAVTAKSLDGSPRGDLFAEVSVVINNGPAAKTKLEFNKDSQRYVGSKIDTTGILGSISFDYTLSVAVPGLGANRLTHKDEKSIGYTITVDSDAHLDVTGKKLEKGDTISLGTAFKFTVSLNNKTHDNIAAKVTFSVLDSSNVQIHQHVQEGASPSFEYTLKSPRIPAGELTFKFEVVDEKRHVSHSRSSVVYHLATPLIASDISLPSTTFNIGQKVQASIIPASFPDLKTVYTFDDEKAAKSRNFYLDVKSASGTLIFSAKGSPVGSKYNFEFVIPNSFEWIGSQVVSFRYVTASGESIALSNYDSASQELYEDTSALSVDVKADLQLADVTSQAAPADFYYGNVITYKFRVRDAISNQYIIASPSFETATVYLSLSHQEKSGRVVRSAHVPATSSDKDFTISWAINPNAVQGAGIVTISAQDIDGTPITIHDSQSKKSVEYKVNIGGHIVVSAKSSTVASLLVEETTFVVQFTLSCQDKRLKDALLKANVVYGGEVLLSVPVVTIPDGTYSVSWTEDHNKVRSGKYTLEFFREVDAQARRLEAEAEQVPLFTVEVYHSAPLRTLPVQGEFLVAIILGATFLAFSHKRSQLAK